MTSEIETLVDRFDAAICPAGACSALKPTAASIKKINEHLGIQLPILLVEFATRSKNFGSWFSSLGPDYESPLHIIRLNSYWRRRRPKRRLPVNLIIINQGFDEDMDCIDTSSCNTSPGEYAIRYWCPEGNTGDPFPSFTAYIESHITYWERSL